MPRSNHFISVIGNTRQHLLYDEHDNAPHNGNRKQMRRFWPCPARKNPD